MADYTDQPDVSVGDATKETHHDVLSANGQHVYDKVPRLVASTGGDYTTLQDADDDLDSGSYLLRVKNGTYAAGVTVSTNDARIVVDPGTVIQGAITLSGSNIELVLGSGSDVQGIVTLSGAGCSLLCRNGVTMDGIVVSAADCLVDGGGWQTVSDGGTSNHGVQVTSGGDRAIVRDISSQTTNGGGQTYDAFRCDGEAAIYRCCRAVDSDQYGFRFETSPALAIGCLVVDAEDSPIRSGVAKMRIEGCHIGPASTAAAAIQVPSTGDNAQLIGNHIEGTHASGAITIDAAAENCVVVGNLTDDAISDSSGTSTVTGNEQY